jgi:L-alanine-DL-glutamate epimerase-like enolase superfamily enzyme
MAAAVASVERFCCHLPLTARQDRILPPGSFRDIRVVHLCKVTLAPGGEVGWGEHTQKGATDAQVASHDGRREESFRRGVYVYCVSFVIIYTKHAKQRLKYGSLPRSMWLRMQVARVVGRSPADTMNDDGISVGLQMALFDALGKLLQVPCHKLLGKQIRDATPLSYWVQSASPEDWAAECADAAAAGYTTCKVKARPWWDIVEQLEAVSAAVPRGFTLDLDFNMTLQVTAPRGPN